MKKNNEEKEEQLLDVIIESIKNKKGKEIVSIDLSKIDNSVCDQFVICHAESTTQVSAIAEEILKKTKQEADQPAHHMEGASNSQWILIDYLQIVVHVFLAEYRRFYHLEELWADGVLTVHND